ncbi:MAG: nicotinate-nucleotide--dimethylbenzimidazole phosphoribosyltransferase [Deltaproteobacteria bacterium]|jgi:nicotinate-nucleotide--dimethylbenzimidazole phosphoribosyltransferase|nr:nicotinate-nucleotide--dimethylbenzimidazole phosphoribosyltransferase [Deltaproteobacteria bacterium]MCL5880249.1 nicotinate-nucleotide--dimethylbenzimidazole phosphoribosyltransferase [Deltaproteobacteria bacterium]MDA8303563.1 nicotinate-nucleotide--dimethylbenzimidazole phosphoribosyltransferase [Deltaproteobacteria bacterium]
MNKRDYLFSLVNSIKPVDKKKFYKIAEYRLNRLIKPKGSLGRLEEFAKDIVAIREEERPYLKNKFVCVFAGDHGVVKEGVSLFKQDVTAQMVRNFLSGGAAINSIANSAGANVLVVDVGINANLEMLAGDNFINGKIKAGTNNIFEAKAMTYDDALKSILKGIEISDIVKAKGADFCATGDMGIGNTTPSSAITCFYSKKPPGLVCGRGTGVSSSIINKKTDIIEKAIKSNIQNGGDPIDVLAGVGGFEIGAIAGFILGCAVNRIPVVVDGFISTAGALIAVNLNSNVSDYMFLGHLSKERGHKTAVNLIKGKKPVLDLSMRLGEGTGAVIAMKIIETAVNMYNNMLTFDEANVFASKLNK